MIPQVIFNEPFFLYLIPIAFLATFILSLTVQRLNRRWVAKFGKRETLKKHSDFKLKRMRGTFWLALIVLFLMLALAEPVLPNSSRAVAKAFNFIAVVDVSKSMGAEDYPGETSRIEMARRCLLSLYEVCPKGSMGFVLFTNQASSYMVTTDHEVLRFLTTHATSLGKVRGEGSTLSAGLGAALGLIKDTPEKVRTIVILSDGGNDDPAEVWELTRLLIEANIRVIGVGLGGDKPVKIPARDPETDEIVGFHRVKDIYALTKLDRRPLAALAEATGGDYVQIVKGDELARVVSEGDYATDVVLETGEESLVKIPLAAMLVTLLVWVVDKRFFQR